MSVLALVIALGAATAAGCGGEESADTASRPADGSAPALAPPAGEAEPEERGGPGGASADQDTPGSAGTVKPEPGGPVEGPEGDPRPTALELAAVRSVRRFVEALDARDGEAACALLAPDALAEVELPRPGSSCAEALRRSIGYRDPRGLPVWLSASVSDIRSVELDGSSARVIATVVTRFADREELSIEDDVVYLRRSGPGWVIAKPSSTLYRAVGIADVPPSVLTPPRG